ncbi:MAG: hypothetical protein ACREDK_09250, partial [Thermoplasmata archaeon]
PVAEVESLEAVPGYVVGDATESLGVAGAPVLEPSLLVEVGDGAVVAEPGVPSVGESVVPEEGELAGEVEEDPLLDGSGVDAVLEGEEHGHRGW